MNTLLAQASSPGSTFIVDEASVHVPRWVVDLSSFRRWAETEDFPEKGQVGYFQGKVWVDMSKQQIFSHLGVQAEYTRGLGTLARSDNRGRYLPDGLFLSNVDVDFAVIPDGTFFTYESLQVGRVRLIEGVHEGFVELEGSPDMVLEVVSRSSLHKDTVVLFHAYWEAGIREYWLVDAREQPLRFDIYHRGRKGYLATRRQRGGWLESAVFGHDFRLTSQNDPAGHPQFSLEVR